MKIFYEGNVEKYRNVFTVDRSIAIQLKRVTLQLTSIQQRCGRKYGRNG